VSRLQARRCRVLLGVLAAAVYVLLACLAYWPVAPLDGSHVVGCACSDQAQEVWFLAWTSFAVLHGHNPFFTTYLMAPRGGNLGVNTSMPLLGLLGLPVTRSAGAVATYNLLLRLALALSGLSMYLLLRRYCSWWPAAFVGGLLYGFSPFLIAQGHLHLFLVFVPLPPLLVALVDDWLLRPKRPPWLSGLLLGAVAGLQYFISPEVLAMTALCMAVAVLVLAFRYRSVIRSRLSGFLVGSATALGVFAVLAGYPVWMLLDGPQAVNGPPHAVQSLGLLRYPLSALVVPTFNQLIDPHGSVALGNPALIQDYAESGLYLGIPLVLLLSALVVRCRREGVVLGAAAGGGAALVLSLGARFALAQHVSSVPLPFRAVAEIPLLQSIEPSRLALLVQLAAAIMLGVGLDRVYRDGVRPSREATISRATAETDSTRSWRAAALLAVAAAALVPLVPRLPYHSVDASVPAYFGSPAVDAVPAGALALTYPWDARPNDDAMLWQVAAGMRFRILGGDVFVPSRDRISVGYVLPPATDAVQHLLLQDTKYYRGPEPSDDAAIRAAFLNLIRTQSVGIVLVLTSSPGAAAVVRVTTEAFGRPPQRIGTIDEWLVQAASPG